MRITHIVQTVPYGLTLRPLRKVQGNNSLNFSESEIIKKLTKKDNSEYFL